MRQPRRRRDPDPIPVAAHVLRRDPALLARDPDRPRLTVAAGGSGHAFKFAPVLGDLIADAVLGEPVPARFSRPPDLRAAGEEAARFRGA